MTNHRPIQVGMNGRFFSNNWRPALQEIAFAKKHGFESMQFQGAADGLSAEQLGASFAEIAIALADSGIVATMEIIVREVGADGRTPEGQTPLDILHNNLPAIEQMPINYVHWHLIAASNVEEEIAQLERDLITQFKAAVVVANAVDFKFGFEHNAPRNPSVFTTPESCAALLEAVDDLHFVWDFNHTRPEDEAAFKALIPRMSHLHLADAPAHETNWHLPIGEGALDYADFVLALKQGGFSGPGILEIGGVPWSGGYGKDSDEALIDSAEKINTAQS